MHGWCAYAWPSVVVPHRNEAGPPLRLLLLESRLQRRDRLRSQQLVANHPAGVVVEGQHGESIFAAVVLLQARAQKIDDGLACSAQTILTATGKPAQTRQ